MYIVNRNTGITLLYFRLFENFELMMIRDRYQNHFKHCNCALNLALCFLCYVYEGTNRENRNCIVAIKIVHVSHDRFFSQ